MYLQLFVCLFVAVSSVSGGHSAVRDITNNRENLFKDSGVETIDTDLSGNLKDDPVPGNTTDLQNNCNNNCNCNPTVTCAPPVNKTGLHEAEVTSYLLQLVKDQQQQIRTLLSLQETCNSVISSATRFASKAKDCQELRLQGVTTSGTYNIYPRENHGPLQVYCDMESPWEGWMVIQRREDGSVNFHRGWEDYRQGFGNVNSEHWIGNDNMHRITTQRLYMLRIEVENWDGKITTATYDKFRVGDSETKYKLILGQYQGDAGDGLSVKSTQIFSTFDEVRDDGLDCGDLNRGGWWGFNSCNGSNLNGHYYDFDVAFGHQDGLIWTEWKGDMYSLKRTVMKIKPSK